MIIKCYHKLPLLAAVLLSASGCSILEDRSDCPCSLTLDFTEVDTLEVGEVRIYAADDEASVLSVEAGSSQFYPEYDISVPRRQLFLNVAHSDGGFFDESEGIVIPPGMDCPRVFMYSSRLDARCEMLRDTVHLHKNHCVVDLRMDKEDASACKICVKGHVNGYGFDGRPRRGEFSYTSALDSDASCQIVLPRQTDSSLVLEIDDGTQVLKTFALGEYIVSGGYDWDAPDLEDLIVQIDWAVTAVNVTVRGWDWVYECEIVI